MDTSAPSMKDRLKSKASIVDNSGLESVVGIVQDGNESNISLGEKKPFMFFQHRWFQANRKV